MTLHRFRYQVVFCRKVVLSVICWVWLCAAAIAQSQAKAELDSNLAETGNPFRLRLYITGQTGKPAQPDFSAWEKVMPGQNILNQTDWQSGNGRWSKELTLIAFDEDTLLLPALPIQLPNGEKVQTNPVTIPVIPTPSGEDLIDMRKLKDIHREGTSWRDYLPWIIGGGLLLLALLIALFIAARRRSKAAVQRAIELPPHELAAKKLAVLEQRRLWQQGQIKEYYGELSFIVREYLQKTYSIPVLESTSDQTIDLLKNKTELPGYLVHGLRKFLEEADLVKFAKAVPPEPYHDTAFRFAQQLVAQTTRVVESQPPTPDNKI
jgi:hypothetical protein